MQVTIALQAFRQSTLRKSMQYNLASLDVLQLALLFWPGAFPDNFAVQRSFLVVS